MITTDARKPINDHKRIVIKIGSALLVDRNQGLKQAWLETLCADIAALRQEGLDVLVVSSGAIAMGRATLSSHDKRLKLEESQAYAAVGQIALARAWSEHLSTHKLSAGQVLLTLNDTEERRRYLNARATIEELLDMGAIPIINENDTVATTEIRYGDNDRLAARVATMVGADLLILLSDIDGLYTAPPQQDQNATFIDFVPQITQDIEKMAGDAGSDLSRGGMRTKIDAGKIATNAGCAMIIASGQRDHPIATIDGGGRSTWFAPAGTPKDARSIWIAGQLEPAGKVLVDQGAISALKSGKSLLPAGVQKVQGQFERGDTISVMGLEGQEIARGLVRYDSAEARQVIGLKTKDIEARLGYMGRSALIHRDDLVMMGAKDKQEAL